MRSYSIQNNKGWIIFALEYLRHWHNLRKQFEILHLKESKILNSTFYNNWDLNTGTRRVRVVLYLFYSTCDVRAVWGNWVQILQIMSRNTWKVKNLEALLDWRSHLGIWFDLFFGVLGIMTLWGKLGPNTLNAKSNSKSSVLYSHQMKPYSSVKAIWGLS